MPAVAEALVPATVVLALLPDAAAVIAGLVALVPPVELAGRAATVPAEAVAVPVPAPAATFGMVAVWVVPAFGDTVVSPLGVGLLLQAARSATPLR